MQDTFFLPLEAAPSPCYWLGTDGTFWCNAAAQGVEDPARQAGVVRRALEALAHERARTPDAPLASTALRLQGLAILTLPAGLLALEGENRDTPTHLLSQALREPLTTIFATLPLVASRMEEEDHSLLEPLQANCYALLRLATNFENFGTAFGQTAHTGLVDLGELVAALTEAADKVCREKGIPIEAQAADEVLLVRADARQLTQAVLNLVRNSLQYTRDGNAVALRVRRAGGRALLTVQDWGLGISPEVLSHIFEPYYSADPYGDSDERPGLGLAGVRELARALGGTVTAESTFGEGTRVTLALPLAQGGGEDVLHSDSLDYLQNKNSPVYVQLAGYCRLPLL